MVLEGSTSNKKRYLVSKCTGMQLGTAITVIPSEWQQHNNNNNNNKNNNNNNNKSQASWGRLELNPNMSP
jgi:hypothetical protein